MIVSKAVRDARKKAQLTRLEKKNDEDYPTFYANQPQQKIMAQTNAQIRLDKEAVLQTTEAVQIAEITGEGLLEAQERAAIARLVLEKRVASQASSTSISLTAVGGL